MTGDCERASSCIFSNMSEAEVNDLLDKVAHRGAKKALAEIGLSEPEDRVSFKELISLFKDYKSAKAATKTWLWGSLRDGLKFARKIVGVVLFLWLLVKIGVPPEKVEQLTRVFK